MEEVQKLKDKIRGLSAQLSNVEFTYRDPARNFERSKVKGVVAKLIKIKDGSTMTALEVLDAFFTISFPLSSKIDADWLIFFLAPILCSLSL